MKIETDAIVILILAVLGTMLGIWLQFSALILWVVEMTAITFVGVVVAGGFIGCGLMCYGAYSIALMMKSNRQSRQIDNQFRQLDLIERKIEIERLANTPLVIEQIKTGHSLALSANANVQLLHNPKPTKVETLPDVEALPQLDNVTPLLDIIKFIKTNHHYWLNGITGDGKTTLCIEFLNQIRLPFPSANVAIIDPKNSADWPIEPVCTSINNVVNILELLCDDLQVRVDNQDYDSEPVIVIVDEHDWLHDELGKDYDRKVRFISKVGRQLNYHIVVMGQSPLSRDNGMSQSSLNNFGRVIFGNEGLKMLNNSAFPFNQIKAELKTQLQDGIAKGDRVALIWPSTKQLPYVAEIPELFNDVGLNFEAKTMKLLPQPTESEQSILDKFDELNTNGKPPSFYSIYKAIYGYKPSGGKAIYPVRDCLRKYGKVA